MIKEVNPDNADSVHPGKVSPVQEAQMTTVCRFLGSSSLGH